MAVQYPYDLMSIAAAKYAVPIKRVLLAHNFYREAGGEDAVYRNEQRLLEAHGIEVFTYERHNNETERYNPFQLVQHGVRVAWNASNYKDIEAIIRQFKPDIAHFHNTFQMISPSAYQACADHHVPVIQTLHNFRLICPGGLLQRDGIPCEKCVGTSLWPALQHRCYRHSLMATVSVVWMLQRNRSAGIYRKAVSRYIALTAFQASRLVAGGIPADRISIKPNCLLDPPAPANGQGGFMVYVGRISEEKGVRTLLRAWREVPNVPIKIVGDGPLRSELQAATHDLVHIEWLGQLDHEQVTDLIGQAVMLVAPSECYEGLPMVILEAYACGTPVLASRIGSLTELIIENETGYLFPPGDTNALATVARRLWDDQPLLHNLRPGVRRRFEKHYTAERNIKILMNIYRSCLQDKAGHLTPILSDRFSTVRAD